MKAGDPTPFQPRRSSLSSAISIAIATQISIMPASIFAAQINPIPNLFGNTIVVTTADADNGVAFDNHGTIDVRSDKTDGQLNGLLTNNGELRNHAGGTLSLSGNVNNNGEALLQNSATGNLTNYAGGMIRVNGYGTTLLNQGELDNAGDIRAESGPTGVYLHIENDAGGTINNAYGGSIVTEGYATYLDNSGVINNDGHISASYSLHNSGTINNNATGTLNVDDVDARFSGSGNLVNRGTANIAPNASNVIRQNIDNYGTLTLGRSQLQNRLQNHAGGTLYTTGTGADGDSLRIHPNNEGGRLYNSGTLRNAAGYFIENNSLLQNQNGGELNNGGTLYNLADLTNQAGGLVRNYGTIDNQNDQRITNSGTLRNYAGGQLTLSGSSAHGGQEQLLNTGDLQNYDGGQINLGGVSAILLNQGTLTNQAGGQIATDPGAPGHSYATLTNDTMGVINNQFGASILMRPGEQNYLVNRGVIHNDGDIGTHYSLHNSGTINNSATATLSVNNGFYGSGNLINRGVADLDLNNSNTLRQEIDNYGSLTLGSTGLRNRLDNHAGASLYTTGTGTSPSNKLRIEAGNEGGRLYNSGTLTNAAGYFIQNDTLLQNESGGVLNNGGTIDNRGTLNNAGTLTIAAGGGIYGSGSFNQTAGVTTVNGTLASDGGLNFSGGVLNGIGQVDVVGGGVLQVGEFAGIMPGLSPGHLTVNGDLVLDGQLVIEIDGLLPGEFDVLSILGDIDFGVTSDILFDFSYDPGTDFDITFLDALSITNFDNVTYSVSGLLGNYDTNLILDGDDLRYAGQYVGTVPIPGALWLMVSGLLFIGGARRAVGRKNRQEVH
ncbi:MAG: hypothetical protein RPU72_06870 [Candidatus Sedimenticola sp. (ex Thyasira tokunagai)]